MKKILITLICLVSFISYGQVKDVKKANKEFEKFAFIDAQQIYLKVVEKGYKNVEILSKLGDTYYFNDELTESYKWYKELFDLDSESLDPEYYFRYAQSLKAVKRYAEADELMAKFNSFKGFDSRSKSYSDQPDYLQIIDFQSGRFEIENTAAINSTAADFGPSFYGGADQIVFATARDTNSFVKRTHSWNDQAFLQLYVADADKAGKLSNEERFSKVINTRYHESTPTFTSDGKTIYFTRNNYNAGVYRQDIDGINKLKIYKSTKEGKSWSDPVELPFNNDEYSVAHPALSPDGKFLYFTSDMPGSMGYEANDEFTKSDLWVAPINEDGSFGDIRNLSEINTEGRESFPFVSKKGILYFASTGHQGLGGLDIFASSINPDGTLSLPINIGKPANTEDDDFAFIINDDTNMGYFSSNRPGGQGDDDIYRFVQLEDLKDACEIILTGTVTDEKTGLPMDKATVMVMDANNNKVDQLVTKANGKYVFKLECGKQYFVRTEKEDYSSDEDLFTTPTQSDFLDVPLAMVNEKIQIVDCDDIAPLLNIKDIYFDFDRFNIRPDAALELSKILAFMELYPQTSVEIRSHTDSRAPDAYNDILSEKRAQSTRKWLIEKGVNASRLTAKGYGERQLVNNCSNGVDCTPEEHQLNRRSEFIVTGLGQYSDCD
ncbi:OmpA family protein [Nonlabens ulvanivorans]|uniref:OmpA family protein n=1 Tax=Nonlabens ulvanivorans TaxID=906888 RepID=UPI00294385D8|nr:OmpA family protein [Nonlabens ulvanivorans]WOI22841.1 OmpA family protein [Nonlabens ulvanivorans]